MFILIFLFILKKKKQTYQFEKYTEDNRYEVKAKKRLQAHSFYYIFDGSNEKKDDFSIKCTDDPMEYILKPELMEKIRELREWNANFFASRTCRLLLNKFVNFQYFNSFISQK